jgi:hypothetical protein
MEGDEGGESSDLAHPASSDGHSCSVHLDVNEGVFWWGWEELLLWDWTYAWLEDQLFMDVGHWQVGSQTHGSWCAIVFFLFNVFGRWTLDVVSCLPHSWEKIKFVVSGVNSTEQNLSVMLPIRRARGEIRTPSQLSIKSCIWCLDGGRNMLATSSQHAHHKLATSLATCTICRGRRERGATWKKCSQHGKSCSQHGKSVRHTMFGY